MAGDLDSTEDIEAEAAELGDVPAAAKGFGQRFESAVIVEGTMAQILFGNVSLLCGGINCESRRSVAATSIVRVAAAGRPEGRAVPTSTYWSAWVVTHG